MVKNTHIDISDVLKSVHWFRLRTEVKKFLIKRVSSCWFCRLKSDKYIPDLL